MMYSFTTYETKKGLFVESFLGTFHSLPKEFFVVKPDGAENYCNNARIFQENALIQEDDVIPHKRASLLDF